MENIEIRRDKFYTISSLLCFPFLYILFFPEKMISSVEINKELPINTLIYFGLCEFLKVFLALTFYPTINNGSEYTNYSSPSPETIVPSTKRNRLPFHKKESNIMSNSANNKTQFRIPLTKPLEFFKGLANFLFSLALCHFFLVIFGAPAIENWTLTLQFSFILVSLLFFPLCLMVRPASILNDLIYISIWDSENKAINRAKWRFLFIIFGTWIGAIVIPLDWDRDWQKWPLPCLFSSVIAHLFINVFFIIYSKKYFSFFPFNSKLFQKIKIKD